ncbi:THAP domain-containing protein 2 [Mizuhopecten yessoensis]|uniref:THAP domain-containing protein 2 n=1 Tax=Mizuhopecten yessoensis TaxID=6573 RepID=A0A210QKW1_MIZYE|nr:THAP domain-containing protein 2 [Mizuhopecten yessoensis]
MVHCAALNCNSNSNNGEKISMFLFPKDKKLRKTWTIKVKRKGFSPASHTRLCQNHFEPGSFVRDPRLMSSIGFEPKSLRLNPGAIPTPFDYSPKCSSSLVHMSTPRPVECVRVCSYRHLSSYMLN